MIAFTKLFQSITTSSIWAEDDKTRLVWITMLALCDSDGVVRASVGGLAHASRVSREDCERALECLSSPDADSRSVEYEGRRIERVNGGFALLNHAKYRDARTQDERTAYMREYMRKHRQKKSGNKVNSKLTVSSALAPVSAPLASLALLAHTEADTDTEEIQNKKESRASAPPPSAPLPFSSPAFAETWTKWKKHRTEIKKPLRPTMEAEQLAELAVWGESRAIAALNHTIAKGWQGIREPDAPTLFTKPLRPADQSDVQATNMKEL